MTLEAIAPASLHGFNHLSAIIEDTNANLMDMFVDRIFKDVYVFEHSLRSNIKFMENVLTPNVNLSDESELEFF